MPYCLWVYEQTLEVRRESEHDTVCLDFLPVDIDYRIREFTAFEEPIVLEVSGMRMALGWKTYCAIPRRGSSVAAMFASLRSSVVRSAAETVGDHDFLLTLTLTTAAMT